MLIKYNRAIGAILTILITQNLTITSDTTLGGDSINPSPQPKRQPIASASMVVTLLEPACKDENTPLAGDSSTPSKLLFTQYCSSCHGNDGTGARAHRELGGTPDFTKATWQSKRTDKALRMSISEGKGTRMPAFGELLSEKEVDSLIVMIRGFAPTTKREQSKREKLGAARPDGFADRFQDLENQLEELRRQFWALSPQKPANRSAHGPP
jgi:mono/diheme cytochrome c family protein